MPWGGDPVCWCSAEQEDDEIQRATGDRHGDQGAEPASSAVTFTLRLKHPDWKTNKDDTFIKTYDDVS